MKLKRVKKLDKLVKEYVRSRDKNTCQHCGKHVSGSNAHVSHVIPRSRGNYLKWDDKNIKLLCFHCHIHWWHKNPVESGMWFMQKFPERWEYLQRNSHKTLKNNQEFIDAKIAEYESRIENLR